MIVKCKRKAICFANQKGGVGKTSATALTAAVLDEKGYKVLVVDADPQGNLTSLYRLYGHEDSYERSTLYEVMTGECKAEDAIYQTQYKNIDCLPSSLELSSADLELSKTGREYILQRALGKSSYDRYDVILIDTPPHLGIMTINALTAADAVVVPMFPDAFGIQGLHQLYRTINTVREYTNHSLHLAGILITRMDYTNLSANIKMLMNEASESLGTKVYKTAIRQAVALRESQYVQKNLLEENVGVADDYRNFVEELEGDLIYDEEA